VLPILDDYGAEVSWRPQGMTKAIPIRVPLKWAAISGSGPSVWTGRALQAESDDLEKLVLRFCIRPHMRALASSYFIPNSHLI
jgi:hypothetical protein